MDHVTVAINDQHAHHHMNYSMIMNTAHAPVRFPAEIHISTARIKALQLPAGDLMSPGGLHFRIYQASPVFYPQAAEIFQHSGLMPTSPGKLP